MYIKNIKLINFRNYSTLDLNLSEKFNIIYGDNAQGKTNILESIFLCASGRSHRTSRDGELVKFNTDSFTVNLDIISKQDNTNIEFKYSFKKKQIKINDITLDKIGKLMGNLLAIVFSPEDLLLVKEGPSERRKFIDISMSQIKPMYFFDLQQYNKILVNRNKLLKDIKELSNNKNKVSNQSLIDSLDIWNSNLVKIGSRICYSRKIFLEKLNFIVKQKHLKLTGNKENISIKYNPSFNTMDFDNILDIEKILLKKIETSVKSDIIRCSTSIGPHRDDYEILINGINLKLFGSQGQQRTAVLSLKLAEIELIKELTGDTPVLLLDDVMSELDKKRQDFLFESLSEVQTIITTTDKTAFKDELLKNSNLIEIQEASIKQKNY